jgi:hypothetical protein
MLEGVPERREKGSRRRDAMTVPLRLDIAMKRFAALLLALFFIVAEIAGSGTRLGAETSIVPRTPDAALDLFDAIQKGKVDATFIARNSKQGRIILKNKTKGPISVGIPDAFIGVPLAQFGGGGMGGGGMGGGGMGGGGMGGGQQSVGGGGGGGRGGGGRGGGGGGFRGGGGGRGGFNIQPEKIKRIDVPLVCLDHGLREPSSSKPYAIRPIENYIKDPAVIEIVAAYANGDLPTGAAQAAVWNLNSGTSWEELAAKLTGTKRQIVREPYFSRDEIRAAMAIVSEAQQMTAGKKVKPRPFKLPGEEEADQENAKEIVSPGDEVSPVKKKADDAEKGEKDDAKQESETGADEVKPA